MYQLASMATRMISFCAIIGYGPMLSRAHSGINRREGWLHGLKSSEDSQGLSITLLTVSESTQSMSDCRAYCNFPISATVFDFLSYSSTRSFYLTIPMIMPLSDTQAFFLYHSRSEVAVWIDGHIAARSQQTVWQGLRAEFNARAQNSSGLAFNV